MKRSMGRMLNSNASPRLGNRPANSRMGASRTVASVLPVPGRVPFLRLPQDIGEVEQGGFQKLAFRAGLAMLFVRITVLSDILFSVLHVNTYLLYLVGPPAILGTFVTGAIGRTFLLGLYLPGCGLDFPPACFCRSPSVHGRGALWTLLSRICFFRSRCCSQLVGWPLHGVTCGRHFSR